MIETADLINGAFEGFGASFLWLNVQRLWRDRAMAGVHWLPTVFFTAWGAWNLFYYPSLGQWVSFAGGLGIVAVNTVWLGSIVYFSRRSARKT